MSVGRHRRKKGIVYGRKIEKDRRGNEQVVPDYERPQVTRMSKHAIRTNRSEIEGS